MHFNANASSMVLRTCPSPSHQNKRHDIQYHHYGVLSHFKYRILWFILTLLGPFYMFDKCDEKEIEWQTCSAREFELRSVRGHLFFIRIWWSCGHCNAILLIIPIANFRSSNDIPNNFFLHGFFFQYFLLVTPVALQHLTFYTGFFFSHFYLPRAFANTELQCRKIISNVGWKQEAVFLKRMKARKNCI